MKLAHGKSAFRDVGGKVVSRADAMFLMVASGVLAVVSTVLTIIGIAGYFTGPVTLELPVAGSGQTASGLELGSTGHYTSLEAVIPAVPTGQAALLAWGGALSQMGILAVLALLFVLAFRLRSAVLFTAGSAWIVGVCGAVLALAGTAGQILDGWARTRLADLIGANGRSDPDFYIFAAEFNIAPLALGLVLVLVAGAFHYGRRLQKDTEGLV
ncbi:hypothetical protein ACFVTE_14285 [Arthrobacter sp. NPDC058097]|uniref:hypothetical protein n=1 Tax=Arthrobacter sp. NPDC058097 TaxID=3346340 RepID=UPI0036DA9526